MVQDTVKEVQQRIAEYSGYEQEIIWDKVEAHEVNVLKKKIEQIYPYQNNPKDNEIIDKTRSTVFDSVWCQRKYTNGYLLSSIFYVAVTKEMDFNKVFQSRKWSLHPVFRTQKCSVNGDGNNTKNCCMIYIDEVGRIYENWNSYIKENVLPCGTMVLPLHGVYNFDEHNNVALVVYETPSSKCKTARQINNVLSKVAVPAAVVPVVALAVPVAAPILVCSSLVCGVAGAASTIACSTNLLDRSKHGQSIDLRDSEARSSWFGVVGGTIGMGAMGSMKALKSLATAGKATTGLEVAVNALNIASLAANGGAVVNGLFYLLQRKKDDEPINASECIQMAASLILFTHSVYNFQLASSIVDDARTGRISDYRKSLSNRQRKIFEKLTKETIRIRGNVNGKIDVIRTVNDMPDAQYLNDLYKINKPLNQNNVRPAFAPGDSKGIILNDQVTVDTNILRQSVQHGQGSNILETVTKPIPPSNSSGNKINVTNTTTAKSNLLIKSCGTNVNRIELHPIYADALLKAGIIFVKEGFTIALKNFGEKFCQNIRNLEAFSAYVIHVYNNCGGDMLNTILNLTKRYIEEFMDELKSVFSTEKIFLKIYEIVMETHSNDIDLNYIEQTNEIFGMIHNYFKSREPQPHQGVKIKCNTCKGSYIITNLERN